MEDKGEGLNRREQWQILEEKELHNSDNSWWALTVIPQFYLISNRVKMDWYLFVLQFTILQVIPIVLQWTLLQSQSLLIRPELAVFMSASLLYCHSRKIHISRKKNHLKRKISFCTCKKNEWQLNRTKNDRPLVIAFLNF